MKISSIDQGDRSEHEVSMHHEGHSMTMRTGPENRQADHQAHNVGDFKKRFWVSLITTLPILGLSPIIQRFLGFGDARRFTGDTYVLFVFSSFVFFYGGYPFLKGIVSELRAARPGMMTLIALAITTAYVYSSAVVFGLAGEVFFWELATLIDIMLLGHWIEMKSVRGASRPSRSWPGSCPRRPINCSRMGP